jgi:hypothetical protein
LLKYVLLLLDNDLRQEYAYLPAQETVQSIARIRKNMGQGHKTKSLIAALAVLMLGGCMGGPIAQQLASSIIMRAADKVVSNSIESSMRAQEEAERNKPLPDKIPDEYWAAFLTSGFSEVNPVVEPLPQQPGPQSTPVKTAASPKVSRLVRVELWNVMLAEEKQSVLEKARLMGATTLPPKDEWAEWKVATGAIANGEEKPLVFLIPPEFGRVSSGQHAVVEMTGLGELHVARYPVN